MRRRGLRALSLVMICVGAALVIDAAVTLVWQEPLSALYTQLRRDDLDDELKRLERTELSLDERRALRRLDDAPERVQFLAAALRRRVERGQPLGRIHIEKLDVDWVLVEGADSASLRKGPAHYPDTSLPGSAGTVGIAGHRTTYGAPFGEIDRLRKGDRIRIYMPYGRFTYSVESYRIVDPRAVEVLRQVGHDRLVLSACHPKYSDAQRLVVFARLDETDSIGTRRMFA